MALLVTLETVFAIQFNLSFSLTMKKPLFDPILEAFNLYQEIIASFTIGTVDDIFVIFSGDGGWTMWSDWQDCSRTCGGGFTQRNRTCTNPSPKPEGVFCSGDPEEIYTCKEDPCPGKCV